MKKQLFKYSVAIYTLGAIIFIGILGAVLFLEAPTSPILAASTYYVGTNGSDINSGSASEPFATIQQAVNIAVAGDTIIVQDGTYGKAGCTTTNGNGASSFAVGIDRSGAPEAFITIKARNKRQAVLDAEMSCYGYFGFGPKASYISIEDFVITRGYWKGIMASGANHHLQFKGNEIHSIGNVASDTNSAFAGIFLGKKTSYITIDGNTFHDIGRTAGKNNWHDQSIYINGSYNTIVNNIFYNTLAGWAIAPTNGHDYLIANNIFYGPAGAGRPGQIVIGNSDAYSPITNIVIRNNIFYGVLNSGVVSCTNAFSGTNSIDHNIINGTSITGILGGDVCGTGTRGLNTIIQNNNRIVDPQFINAAEYDFHYTSSSPAIDAGVIVPEATTDFDGDPRPLGQNYDIGAYEFVPAQ